MREWLVAGAVIEHEGRVLLVHNRRRGGRSDWSPPGGVIDEGETVLDGLTREVQEETGLRVQGWRGPIYEIATEAPGLGWRLRVEAYEATGWEGEIVVDDPDGIVVDVQWVEGGQTAFHLEGCPPWVREPLSEFLAERWVESRAFAFDVDGDDMASLSITRRALD